MKLHEEFKEYEELWEAAEENTSDASNPLVRTFGRKTYNLANREELDAWFKANYEFQQKRYPSRYRDSEGDITSNWLKLRATIAKNLIASLEADGVTDPDILDYLRNKVKVGSGLGKVFREDEVSKILTSMTSALTSEEKKLIKPELEAIKQKLLTIKKNPLSKK